MAMFNSKDYFEANEKMETLIKAAEIVADYGVIDVDDIIDRLYAIKDEYHPAMDFVEQEKLGMQFMEAFNDVIFWSDNG